MVLFSQTKNVLNNIIENFPQPFKNIADSSQHYYLQIIYTQIDRNDKNNPNFTTYYWGDTNQYFYPASTVKLPTALCALQKINSLNIKELSKESILITEKSTQANIPATYNSPNSQNGYPSIAQYIKEILLVSSNESYNRLYEFVGQKQLQSCLESKGFHDVAIRHRLEVSRTPIQNQWQNEINFYAPLTGNKIHSQPEAQSIAHFKPYQEFIGTGYLNSDGKLINQPLDFSNKNKMPLTQLHQLIKSIIFFEETPINQKINLSLEDRAFILKYMSMYPNHATLPSYPELNNYPAYCKFLLLGADTGKIDPEIRIFNKVGDAYGFLIDAAYIIDLKNKVEFILSACIYVNQDGILNDSHYDYNTIGYPFFKKLGQQIYQYELSRPKKYKPNFDNLLSFEQK